MSALRLGFEKKREKTHTMTMAAVMVAGRIVKTKIKLRKGKNSDLHSVVSSFYALVSPI